MKIKGELRISRVSPSDEDDYVEIELVDSDARVEAVSIKLAMADYAKVLFSSSCDCEFDWNDSGRVGTVGENKEELVPVPDWKERAEDWIDVALSPFRVDGWRERVGDIENHHRHTRKGSQDYQLVVFFRNVPKDTGASVIDGGER